MKKSTAFIGAILSLLPIGQAFLIKTSVVLPTAGFILPIPQKAIAESAEFYNESGFKKIENGDFDGAISDFTKALKLNPKYADGYYYRGLSQGRLGNYQEAIDDYTKAIELHPKVIAPYIDRAKSKEGLKDYQGAISDYTKVIELIPKASGPYFSRAKSKEGLKDYQGAIDDLTKAIKLNPNERYFFYRGLVKYAMNDYLGSISDYSKLIKMKSIEFYGDSYLGRCMAKEKLKMYQGALEDCSRAIESNPKVFHYFSIRATVNDKLKDYKGAIKDYSKALEINPENSTILARRGYLKGIVFNDYSGAIEDFTKAIKLNPIFLESYFNRGIAKQRLGKMKEACLDWNKAYSLTEIQFPNHPKTSAINQAIKKSCE